MTAPRKTTVVSKFATSYGVYDALELLGLMSVLNDSELPMLLNASIVHELISGLVEMHGHTSNYACSIESIELRS